MPIFTAAAIAITGAAAGSFIVGATAFGLQVAAGIGMNLLAQKVAGKKNTPQAQGNTSGPGYSVQGRLSSGGDVPRSFPIGYRCTAGSLVYANTWGSAGETPNAYLTQVIAVSDMPVSSATGIDGLVGMFVNGERVTFGDTPHADRGYPVIEYRVSGTDYLWVKFYDGTQTVADAFLTGTVASTERPYESTRVGTGIAYAIVTARVKDDLFSGFPSFKFETLGIPLYDISKDSTQGGDGLHRWDDPSTWGGDGDQLPIVQIYNILRGVRYDGEWLYGLQGMSGARLPAANWIAQIEKCREAVDGVDGTESEPRYRSSLECFVSNEIAETIEQLLTACQGRLAETGGTYKIHCGAPDEPVMSFTDDDIISTQEQSFTPFFGLSDTVNGINAKYPDPAQGWNTKVAPPIYRTDLEELAGGRRLMADVPLDAVPYARQVQQLMQEALQEAQRARRHTFVLPPRFWPVEPGDIVEWTSVRNGYETKLFRVDGVVDQANLDVMVDLTEIDPADYDFDFDNDYTAPVEGPLIIVRPPAQAIVDFDAYASEVEGDVIGQKRPGIVLTWEGGVTDDITAVRFEVRRDSDEEVIYQGRCDEPSAGSCLIEGNGLLPLTDYEVRGRYIPASPRETSWSGWIPVTTTDTRFSWDDFNSGIRDIVQRELQEQFANISFNQQRIASAATEQDFANALDKRTVRILLAEQGLVIAETAQIVEDSEGQLAGAYWLTLDLNGYVTGYQLYNGGPGSSSFTVVADKFIVAQPGETGGDPKPVFALGTVDGTPTLVLDGDILADGTISARAIAAESITADKIVANSLTVEQINSAWATFNFGAFNTGAVSESGVTLRLNIPNGASAGSNSSYVTSDIITQTVEAPESGLITFVGVLAVGTAVTGALQQATTCQVLAEVEVLENASPLESFTLGPSTVGVTSTLDETKQRFIAVTPGADITINVRLGLIRNYTGNFTGGTLPANYTLDADIGGLNFVSFVPDNMN